MIHRLKNPDTVDINRASWIKADIDIMKAQNLFFFGGRGVSKTTDIIANRVVDVVYEMPQAPLLFTSDTYINLMTNVVPNVIRGMEERGKFYKGDHFVVDQPPKTGWDDPYYKHIFSYKHTISTYNGCFFYLTSLDRPSANAGLSVVHIFGDESKYLKIAKLNKLFPTLRGDETLFGHSPYFLGKTFCSDMANPTIGEDPWMVDMADAMNVDQTLMALHAGYEVNEIRRELIELQLSDGFDEKSEELIKKKLTRWEERHNKVRRMLTFYYNASSFANAEILTLEYFINMGKTLSKEEFNTAILGIPTFVEKGKRFYPGLNDRHFYGDGTDFAEMDRYGLMDGLQDSCKLLTRLDKDTELDAGFDAGNMCSLVMGQLLGADYNVLKNIHTLAPSYIPELGREFVRYFEYHRKKKLNLYHDRATNQYSKVKRDQAHELKKWIEFDEHGKRTGWRVDLKSIGQRNIEHEEEYNFMIAMMNERNKRLPRLWIDEHNCKEMKSSLETAEMTQTAGRIKKKKTSEKMAIKRLPAESTNYSDAFKYLLCRKEWLKFVQSKGDTSDWGDVGVMG